MKNLAWAILATVTGAFFVALLYKAQLMDRAATSCLYWLTAVIAALTVIMLLVFGSSSDGSGTASSSH